MEKKALQFYRQGYNCSQCILKALESEHKVPISKQCYSMCSCVNTGFGVGGMCSVLIAGIMAFGILFDHDTAKRLRMKLLSRFTSEYGHLDCATLKSQRGRSSNCDELVSNIAKMIDEIIYEENR